MSSGGDASKAAEGLDKKAIMSKLMQDPALMEMMQQKLAGLEGAKSEFFASLPKHIKNRVYALRNIQREYMNVEADFYSKINDLEKEFEAKYQPLFERRSAILAGNHEPTEEECDHTDSESEENGDANNSNGDMKTDEESAYPKDAKGIPEFWLSVLKSARPTEGLIEPHDEEILKFLTDIKVNILPSSKDNDGIDTSSFQLIFSFSKNSFFSNETVTKTYILKCRPDPELQLQYEGPEVMSFNSSEINWLSKELNPCKKIVKKKQTNKKTGQSRIIEKTETQDSFFSFFQPLEERRFITEDDPEDEEFDQNEAILEADYEIGHFIRERIVPRAVLFFTGELDDDDEEDYDDEDGEGSDDMNAMLDDQGSDEADDPDFDPSTVKQQPECKQQ